MGEIEQLLERRILWEESKESGVLFIAEIDGEHCTLRMNDFPDEVLYTLSYKGKDISFDDAPRLWVIPAMKEGRNGVRS